MAIRRAFVVACWSAWAAAAPAQQPVPTGATRSATSAPMFVEVDGLPAEVFVQQTFDLVVRVGVDTAWLQQHAVPMFQQKLDQPFHVVVPWLQAAEDRAVELLPTPAGATTQRLAFGDRAVPFVVAGAREVEGRRYELLTATLRWTALAPGRSLVAPVELRYAFAERFVEDFLRGREPVDRQEATIASPAAALSVTPLPPLPPAGFCGAVGEFTLQASTAVQAATVGSSVPLRLEVRGVGNLQRMAPLPPPLLPGFHVQGVTSAMVAGARVFTLDLLPLRAGTTQVPPVPFVAFSPRERRYVTLTSAAVPLSVAPTPAGVELPPRVRLRIDLDRLELAAANEWPLWRYVALVGSVLVFVQLARGRRRRALFDRRRAANHERLVAALASGPVEALEAFDACVLHATGDATTVEVAWQRLAQRPVPAAAVVRLQAVRQALDAARFGGQAPAASEVLSAVRDVASAP